MFKKCNLRCCCKNDSIQNVYFWQFSCSSAIWSHQKWVALVWYEVFKGVAEVKQEGWHLKQQLLQLHLKKFTWLFQVCKFVPLINKNLFLDWYLDEDMWKTIIGHSPQLHSCLNCSTQQKTTSINWCWNTLFIKPLDIILQTSQISTSNSNWLWFLLHKFFSIIPWLGLSSSLIL